MKHTDQRPTAVIETPEDHTIMLTSFRPAPSSLNQLLHESFEYRRRRRPMYPFESTAAYVAGGGPTV